MDPTFSMPVWQKWTNKQSISTINRSSQTALLTFLSAHSSLFRNTIPIFSTLSETLISFSPFTLKKRSSLLIDSENRSKVKLWSAYLYIQSLPLPSCYRKSKAPLSIDALDLIYSAFSGKLTLFAFSTLSCICRAKASWQQLWWRWTAQWNHIPISLN